MDYRNILSGIVIVAVISLMIRVAKAGRPTPTDDGKALSFRHTGLFRGFALISLIVLPGGILLSDIFGETHPSDPWAIPFICGLLLAIATPMCLEAFRYALIVSPEGLDCHSPWRGRFFIAWGDVSQLSYSTINGWFVIKSKAGKSFRVHMFVSGLDEFLEQCERYLSLAALAKSKPGYDMVGRTFPGL